MKKIFQSLYGWLFVMAVAGICASCTKDDQPNNGIPLVKYVRVTNPVSSDSLLTGAFQGNLVAIIGENLQDATEIWFNDQKASLTPTYITNTSILVSIPSPIPKVITNKMKIVFKGGNVLLYDFKVQISEPVVAALDCEYVLTGQEGVLRGDYFYEPLSITFEGGAKAELTSVTDKIVKFRVPVGAQPGQITVTTNFGVTKSNFWFRDNRNIFLSSDPFTGWWNSAYVVTSPGAGDPPAINGNYIRVKKVIGAWAWTEVAGGPATAMGDISKNIPDAAILKPSDYNLKFEVNTLKPYNNNVLKINVGLLSENNDNYKWLPPYDTKGQWQTVTIPFEDVANSYGKPLTVSPDGYWTRLLFHGGGDLDCDMSFDNFRVVPKLLKK
ncbi:MAG TPA: glycan-binding surface protein [Chitinophagaceae bacterium]|nr:glycan-binding surface protein [Chitinophagaceae bacterium]